MKNNCITFILNVPENKSKAAGLYKYLQNKISADCVCPRCRPQVSPAAVSFVRKSTTVKKRNLGT